MNSDKFAWTVDSKNHLVWFDMEVIFKLTVIYIYLLSIIYVMKSQHMEKPVEKRMTTSEQISGLVLQAE
jgi:hypothetical protein